MRNRLVAAWTAAWSLAALVLATAIALGPLDRIPHVQDEVVYTWQAERLAEGRLWTPQPSPRAAWVYDFFIDDGTRRIGSFPSGWPAVLAVGVGAGLPWLVNPLLQALTVLVGSRLARRLGGGPASLVAAPFLALSPQAALLGASRMSQTLVGLLAVTAFSSLCWIPGENGRRNALVLGSSLGSMTLARPFDAAILALPLLVAFLWRNRDRRAWLLGAAPLLAALLLTAAQNLAITGSALRFPQTMYFDEMPPPIGQAAWRDSPGCNGLGFGPGHGCFPTWGSYGHTPEKGLLNTVQNLRLVSTLWLGSPWCLLLLVPALADRATRRFALWAVGLLAALVAAYFFYWYPGSCFGARYYHPALPLVIVACAVAAERLSARLLRTPALALLLLVPMSFRLMAAAPELESYWGVDARFDRLESSWTQGPALVLIRYRFEPILARYGETALEVQKIEPHRRRGSWFLARGPITFAEYHPELVRETLAGFPGRKTYLYTMGIESKRDELRPLLPTDIAPVQLKDLEPPFDLVLVEGRR